MWTSSDIPIETIEAHRLPLGRAHDREMIDRNPCSLAPGASKCSLSDYSSMGMEIGNESGNVGEINACSDSHTSSDGSIFLVVDAILAVLPPPVSRFRLATDFGVALKNKREPLLSPPDMVSSPIYNSDREND